MLGARKLSLENEKKEALKLLDPSCTVIDRVEGA